MYPDMKKQQERGKDPKSDRVVEDPGKEDVYIFSHSGIHEKHGIIPGWLKAVVFGLIVWGVYYTIRYWDAP